MWREGRPGKRGFCDCRTPAIDTPQPEMNSCQRRKAESTTKEKAPAALQVAAQGRPIYTAHYSSTTDDREADRIFNSVLVGGRTAALPVCLRRAPVHSGTWGLIERGLPGEDAQGKNIACTLVTNAPLAPPRRALSLAGVIESLQAASLQGVYLGVS